MPHAVSLLMFLLILVGQTMMATGGVAAACTCGAAVYASCLGVCFTVGAAAMSIPGFNIGFAASGAPLAGAAACTSGCSAAAAHAAACAACLPTP